MVKKKPMDLGPATSLYKEASVQMSTDSMGQKFFIYIPTEVARDSSFPVKPGQEVEVQIDLLKGILVVQPLETKARGRQHSKKEK